MGLRLRRALVSCEHIRTHQPALQALSDEAQALAWAGWRSTYPNLSINPPLGMPPILHLEDAAPPNLC